MGTVGLYLGILGGILYDQLGPKRTRYGRRSNPFDRPTALSSHSLIGGTVLFFAYFGVFMAFATTHAAAALMGFLFFCIGQGSRTTQTSPHHLSITLLSFLCLSL